MGELGVGNHCYLPLLFAKLRRYLPRVNLAVSTGTYVPKFIKWAPLGENFIGRKDDVNGGFGPYPGQDPSPQPPGIQGSRYYQGVWHIQSGDRLAEHFHR